MQIKFEKRDIKPALIAIFWLVGFYLLFVSGTGSIEEFEPQAAVVWFAATGAWCLPPLVLLVKRLKRG